MPDVLDPGDSEQAMTFLDIYPQDGWRLQRVLVVRKQVDVSQSIDKGFSFVTVSTEGGENGKRHFQMAFYGWVNAIAKFVIEFGSAATFD